MALERRGRSSKTTFLDRRWFARFEGTSPSAAEKALLVVFGYALGGLGYLAVNQWVGDGPFHRLDLPLDRSIPFVPAFVFGYVLVYFTPALCALLITDRAEIYRTFTAFGLSALICFSIFLIFPVELPRTLPLPDTLSGRVLGLVQAMDRPVNCFPSHHIATSLTAFFAAWRQNRFWGALFGASALIVTISTLFVKQHYLLDVPGGIGVAFLTYALCFPPRAKSV